MKTREHHRGLLALQQVEGLGTQRILALLRNFSGEPVMDLFSKSPAEFSRVDGISKVSIRNLLTFDDWDSVDRLLERTEKTDATLISFDSEEYPSSLKQIYDPPLLLWCKGDLSSLQTSGIAVVGTRRPGRYGLDQTEFWVTELVRQQICINSGLAYGVDSRAHQTALQHGGKTVAVLGSGIDVIYPQKNSRLAREIIKSGGAVLSEQPPGTPPDARNFPGRNRIVSGMSSGVLVVESGIKGGSMITARFALDQNREVFVVPHPLGQLQGEGCNYLIRTGQGKLVQSVEDILDEVSIRSSGEARRLQRVKQWEQAELENHEEELCRYLDEPRHIDDISEQLGQSSAKLLPLMLELEMKGVIRQTAGKYFEAC